MGGRGAASGHSKVGKAGGGGLPAKLLNNGSIQDAVNAINNKYDTNIQLGPMPKNINTGEVKQFLSGVDKVFHDFPAARGEIEYIGFGTSLRSPVRGAKIAAQTSRKDKAIRLGDFYTEKDTILNITRMHSAEQQGAHEAAHAYANSVWRKRGFEGRAPEAQVVFDALSRSGALHSIKAKKEALRTISWYASKDKSANGYREAFAEAISKTITKGENASPLARAIYKGAKNLQ